MSVAQGLQIHSNVSIPLSPQLAEEQAAPAPVGLLDHEEPPKSIYIGKKNFKSFLIGSSLALLFLYCLIMTVVGFFLFLSRKRYKALFRNYSHIGNGYDIAATVLLLLTLIIVSIAPTYGRKAWKIPFVVIIFLSVPYLCAFLLRQGMRTHNFQYAEYLLPIFLMLATGALGLFINVAATKKKVGLALGVLISVVLFSGLFIAYIYIFERMAPYLWEMALYIASSALVALYFNLDAALMVKKRYDFYRRNDWFLGFVHLQTDWLFRFWYDLFVRRRSVEFDVDEKGQYESDITQITSEN